MAHNKQFTLFTAPLSPFSKNVMFVLHELGLTYEAVYLDLQKAEQKADNYTKYNPNGQIPALVDHTNSDLTLWESCAIIQYLIENYDPEHKVSATGNDKYVINEWLFFQAATQSVSLRSYYYFTMRHPEKVPSLIERYQNEVLRVLGVLERVLTKQEWLVGDKLTVADIVFVPFSPLGFEKYLDVSVFDVEHKFPSVHRWLNIIVSRPAVKEVLEIVDGPA